jgi:hypothetical protein
VLSLKATRACALCRASIPEDFDPADAPLDEPVEQVLIRACTVEYAQRLEDVAWQAAQLVQLRIGNKYELLSFHPRMTHKWTVEVELQPHPASALPRGALLPDLIESVRFGLKPAFRVLSYGSENGNQPEVSQDSPAPPFIDVKEAPFQVTCKSFLACSVPIIVTWKDWVGRPPLRLDHELDFHRDGGFWDYGVDLQDALTTSNVEDRQVTLQQQQQVTLESRSPMREFMQTPAKGQQSEVGNSTVRTGATSSGEAQPSSFFSKLRRKIPGPRMLSRRR